MVLVGGGAGIRARMLVVGMGKVEVGEGLCEEGARMSEVKATYPA